MCYSPAGICVAVGSGASAAHGSALGALSAQRGPWAFAAHPCPPQAGHCWEQQQQHDGRAQSPRDEGAGTARTSTGTRALLTLEVPNHLTLAFAQQPPLLSLLCSQGPAEPAPGCPQEDLSHGHPPPLSATPLLLPGVPCAPGPRLRVFTHQANSSSPACPEFPLLPLTSPFNVSPGLSPHRGPCRWIPVQSRAVLICSLTPWRGGETRSKPWGWWGTLSPPGTPTAGGVTLMQMVVRA